MRIMSKQIKRGSGVLTVARLPNRKGLVMSKKAQAGY
jgi:hypothetical protein